VAAVSTLIEISRVEIHEVLENARGLADVQGTQAKRMSEIGSVLDRLQSLVAMWAWWRVPVAGGAAVWVLFGLCE
jgi:hypothetical protein